MLKTASVPLVLISVCLSTGCTPYWQKALPRVSRIAASEIGCPVEQLDLKPIDPDNTTSALAISGCGKHATYVHTMSVEAGYILSSVRQGTDVAVRRQEGAQAQ